MIGQRPWVHPPGTIKDSRLVGAPCTSRPFPDLPACAPIRRHHNGLLMSFQPTPQQQRQTIDLSVGFL